MAKLTKTIKVNNYILVTKKIQTVAASCYYGTEISLQCMRNLKTKLLGR